MWAEFDRISPLGDERADIRAAQIVSQFTGRAGCQSSLNEAILQWEVVPANNIKDPFTVCLKMHYLQRHNDLLTYWIMIPIFIK